MTGRPLAPLRLIYGPHRGLKHWRVAVGVKDATGKAATGRYAFRVFLQHKALSDRRRDDAIPEPLGQLSQRPPAGAVRRGDQLEVEGL